MFGRQAISRHAQFSLAIAIATSSFSTHFFRVTYKYFYDYLLMCCL